MRPCLPTPPNRMSVLAPKTGMASFRLLSAFVLFGLALLQGSASSRAEDRAVEVARRMGRGVNILGYDGIWDGHADAPFRLSSLKMIHDAGFGHVRINLFGFKHMDASNRLNETTLESLDTVLDRSIKAGLVPVLDEHDYSQCQDDPEACATKLKAFWNQISARYVGRFPSAVFEILNEPGGAMAPDRWNRLFLDVLNEIRASNPDRTVVVAALNSDDPGTVTALDLPPGDRNIIITVHYYKPFEFTHQGAPWSPRVAGLHDIGWGGAEDEKRIADDFAVVDRWARSVRRPVYLGEFGVYDRAPILARARYLAFVARTAERLGWTWAYWQFDHDFALFDTAQERWIAPILSALIPSAVAPRQRRRSAPRAWP